jgi:hypothetical protein
MKESEKVVEMLSLVYQNKLLYLDVARGYELRLQPFNATR